MKNNLIKTVLFLGISSIIFSSCGKSIDKNTEQETEKVASFNIEGKNYSATSYYLTVVNNGGTITNSLKINANNGSKVEINFKGSDMTTFPLKNNTDAVYISPTGKKYYSTSGSLVITSYFKELSTYTAMGTFNFLAKCIDAPGDIIEISSGQFINASN